MKKQKTVSPATAPAVESAPAPQVSETTAQRDSANRKVSIPAELTKPNERRAFALAYRRTLDGRKLDFMPGALIPALAGAVTDAAGIFASFLVPLACYVLLVLFAASAAKAPVLRRAASESVH